MRTIGKNASKHVLRKDREAICEICGVQWHRSKLRRDRSGLLRCPDDRDGLDAVTLSEMNARHAQRPPRQEPPSSGHRDDGSAGDEDATQRTTNESIYT